MNKLPEDPIKYLRLADFSGGRNTTITPALLNANESPTAKRMSFDQKGTIRPGWGRVSRYDEPFSDQPVSGLGEYRKNDGRTWLMIGAGDKIYYDRPSMTWKWEGDALPDDMLKPPGDPTFTRSSVAYKTDGTQVSANVPRFEDGKFGKAVMVEEETTNAFNNPNFEDGTTGWGTGGFSDNTLLTSVTDDVYSGSKAVRVERVSGSMLGTGATISQNIGTRIVLTQNQSVTVSFYVKGKGNTIDKTVWAYIYTTDGANIVIVSRGKLYTLTGDWQRISHTLTWPYATSTTNIYGYCRVENINIGDYFYVDDAQLEAKPYATSFIDGTRAAETLTIPTYGVLNPQEGTIEFWWCPINQPASTMTGSQTVAPPIIQVGNYYQNNSWILWCGMGSQLKLFVRGDNATGWTGQWTIIPNLSWYQLNRWYHIVVRWENANTFWVFIDGVKYGPYVSSQPFTGIAGNIMSLGRLNASSGPSNALYDDLRISSIARSDDEIQIEA